MQVVEVDSQGFVIDEPTLSEEEIETARESGRKIIMTPWEYPFFKPKYDFSLDEWIEGLDAEEVKARRKELADFNSMPSREDMNAMAIMELTEMILGGR